MSGTPTRGELINRLNELNAVESNAQMMQAFQDSLHQIKDVLNDQAADTEAATETIEEITDAVDKFKDVVQGAKDLLQTQSLDGLIKGAGAVSDTGGKIADGVEKLGGKSKEVADGVEKLSQMIDKIEDLQEIDGAHADQLISELGNMISTLTDLLGPLVDAVPVIGPFLDMYVQAIDSISKSVKSINTSIRNLNTAARQAGLDPVYILTTSGSAKRAKEIADIKSKLDEIGWYDPPNTISKQPTKAELRAHVDANAAFDKGLTNCGCGEGAASPRDGWHQAKRRLEMARQRLALTHQRAGGVEWMADQMPRIERENAEAAQALVSASAATAAATSAAKAAETAHTTDVSTISQALDTEKAAKTAEATAYSDAVRSQRQVDRFNSAKSDLENAKTEYDTAYDRVKDCFDKMKDALPDSDSFDLSRDVLINLFSPDGRFETSIVPRADRTLNVLKAASPKIRTAPVSVEPTEEKNRKPLLLAGAAGMMIVIFIAIMFSVLFGGGDGDTTDAVDQVGDGDGDTKSVLDDGGGDVTFDGDSKGPETALGGSADVSPVEPKGMITAGLSIDSLAGGGKTYEPNERIKLALGDPRDEDSTLEGEIEFSLNDTGEITFFVPTDLVPPANGFAGIGAYAVDADGTANYNECGHSTDRGTNSCNQWEIAGYANCESYDNPPSTPGQEWKLPTFLTAGGPNDTNGDEVNDLFVDFEGHEQVIDTSACDLIGGPSAVETIFYIWVDFDAGIQSSATLDIKGALAANG